MLYSRGNKADYNRWAAGGATGWSWEEVLPYFMKSEDNTDPALLSNGKYQVVILLNTESCHAPKDRIALFSREEKEIKV